MTRMAFKRVPLGGPVGTTQLRVAGPTRSRPEEPLNTILVAICLPRSVLWSSMRVRGFSALLLGLLALLLLLLLLLGLLLLGLLRQLLRATRIFKR